MNRVFGAWLVLRGKATWARRGQPGPVVTWSASTTSSHPYSYNATFTPPPTLPNFWISYPKA